MRSEDPSDTLEIDPRQPGDQRGDNNQDHTRAIEVPRDNQAGPTTVVESATAEVPVEHVHQEPPVPVAPSGEGVLEAARTVAATAGETGNGHAEGDPADPGADTVPIAGSADVDLERNVASLLERSPARPRPAAASKPAPLAPSQPVAWPANTPPATETGKVGGQELLTSPSRPGINLPEPIKKYGLWMVGAVVVLALVVVVAAAALGSGQSDRFYAGTTIYGVPVGGMTKQQAVAALQRGTQGIDRPVTLLFQEKKWQPGNSDVGVAIDVQSTVDAAYDQRPGSGFFGQLFMALGLSRSHTDMPLTVTLQQAKLNSYLGGIAKEIDQPASEGDVYLDGLKVVTVPSQTGRTMDVARATDMVQAALRSGLGAQVDLPVSVADPAMTPAEVQSAAQVLSRTVGSPLTLKFEDKTWEMSPDAIAQMLDIRRPSKTDTNRNIVVSLKPDQLSAFLGGIAKEIDQEPQDARFQWNGGLVPIHDSKDGRALQIPEAADAINRQLTQDQRVVDLPVKVAPARISSSNPDALGIKELIASGKSSYSGSAPERRHNIETAVKYLTGAIIMPGEEFSFLDTLGPITSDRGYDEGYVIVGDETKKDVGGGVCQVSTTVFRAAFWSGLPITERNQHAYRVSWYEQGGDPVGFDAAVFEGSADFKFKNTTSTAMLLQAWADGSSLVVDLYGTKQGWDVSLDGPYISNPVKAPADVQVVDDTLAKGDRTQVEWAHDGLDVTIKRIIRQGGEVISTDQFFSRYQAWPNKFLVGPGEGTPTVSPTAGTQTPSPDTTPTVTPVPDTPTPAPDTATPEPSPTKRKPQPTPTP